MGNLCDRGFQHDISVATGDRRGVGQDANLYMILYDDDGNMAKEFNLGGLFTEDFEKPKTDVFKGPYLDLFGNVEEIEIWRDSLEQEDTWFCNLILIKDPRNHKQYVFPVERYIQPGTHYIIQVYNTLPSQFDKTPDMRRQDLEEMKKRYQYEEKYPGFPPLVREILDTEGDAKMPLKDKIEQIINKNNLSKYLDGEWKSISRIKKMFGSSDLPNPKGLSQYDNDAWFAAQRLIGCNSAMIKICNEVPNNLPITNEMVKNVIGNGNTLEDLIEQERLFSVDLKVLKDLPTIDMRTLVAPIALFYTDNKKILRPLAIQLYQRPSAENPIFLPSDSMYTWLLAKIWFSQADAMAHIAIRYLGITHFLLEGVTICTKRHVAVNHPVHRLLKPFLEEVLLTNAAIMPYLLEENGWLDECTQLGRRGAAQLIERVMSIWHIDDHGYLPKDIESRGVADPEILPFYPYRDDGLKIFDAIHEYVETIISYYYPDSDTVQDDQELQDWGRELSKGQDTGGLAIKGLPNNGHLMEPDDIIILCTSIIFLCTVENTAASMPMFDQYAFTVNCPTRIDTEPPCDKKAKMASDILDALPEKPVSLYTAIISRLLSRKPARTTLGNWPLYEYDPVAMQAKTKLRYTLGQISRQIQQDNERRPSQYRTLIFDPINICCSVGF